MKGIKQLSRDSLVDIVATSIVAAVAAGCAASMFAQYFQNPATVWHSLELGHDRASHYMLGLDVAIALRTLDPIEFLARLEEVRAWAPLHPLVLGVTLTLGGLDHRIAILPGLAGWVLTVVLTWLIARRLAAGRMQQLVAGVVAVTFAVASPAFRTVSADIMLEGLGAGLTALALWLYVRACEAPQDNGRWRALSIALTLLFFEKQNYWLLTAAALALASFSAAPRDWLGRARELAAGIDLRRFGLKLLMDPLLVAFAVACAASVIIALHGDRPFVLFGRSVWLYPPRNPLTLAWGLLFLRCAIAWYRHRAVFDEAIGGIGRALFYWQAVPIAVYLLLPHRLQYVVMYLSPANSFPTQHFEPWAAAAFYLRSLTEDYHVAPWSFVLAIFLAAAALARLGRVPPSHRAPMMLLLVSTAAVVLHPNVNMRYVASWIFSLWICAGVGAAVILQAVTSRFSTAPRALATGIMVCALVGAHIRASSSAAAEVARGATRPPSELELSAAYLPHLAGFTDVGFVLSFGPHHFATWTVREQCRCRAVIEWPGIPATTRAEARDTVEQWVARTRAQRIVVINAPDVPLPPQSDWMRDWALGVLDGLANQDRFVMIALIPVPSFPAKISIWAPAAAAEQ